MIAEGALELRPATAADLPLLERAVLQNANAVHPGTLAAADLATDARHRHYLFGFPEGAADFGVVAEAPDGRPLGVAWARCSGVDDPAPGRVADDVPELVINVFEGSRGLGIGHELLTELEKEALRRGFDRLSLWVEDGNRSRRLYERHGFSGEGQVMTRQL